ncbi:MAG: ketopantoate hydroxymethyltransferase [Armatimonadetes bacterium]|jgi:3-methyl-2-oxobutanoate hydroxymethyltransferase|nr:ketopantoate hydroxymethyltransferase [Armatimonadota bacterium]
MSERKPVTALDLPAKKARGERIVVVTAYDYPTAHYADAAGVDALLVGDSLGMVVLGHETTLPVTLEAIIYHTQAVCRARPKALVIADLPFLTYQVNPDEAMRNAGRLLQEGGAAAVKLEGGAAVAATVARLTAAGIPVMGHLGLTPQSTHAVGRRIQARRPEQARQLLEDARALEQAGAFGIVLETIPSEVAREVSSELRIPTIGIGAGPHCDGEVQVLHDLLGLYDRFSPKHSKQYAELGRAMTEAITAYAADVRSGAFPAEANTFHEPGLEDATWKS